MSKPQTLIELLQDRAVHDPGASALTFQDTSHSFGDLWGAVSRVASNLCRRGLERHSRVVVALPNGLEFLAVFYGIQRAGGVPVPTFPGSGSNRLQDLARRCTAETIIVGDLRQDDEKTDGTAELIAAEALLSSEVDATAESIDFPTIAPDDLAYIQFTSGSTGDPKGVQLSHANALINIRQLTAGFEITPQDVFVSWLPAYHDMGLVLMTMVPFSLGARLMLLPASLRSLRPWLAAIDKYRGTFTAAPDFGYRMALRVQQDREGHDLSSLRVALNAAEPVRAGTIEAFERTFDLQNVMIAGYGLAEATVGVCAWQPGKPPLVDATGSVSVGQPFPEVELAILRGEKLVGPGELGEILVKSPANTRGYWDEVSGDELFTQDGSLRTGDLGYRDSDGYLFVVGRLKQMIIQAGRNIAPREVEEIVDALPFVRRSAAVGIDRGDTAGEQLYVFAELRAKAKPESVTCREHVVEIVDLINSHLGLRPGRAYLAAPRTIPFTANGKVRYGELKDAHSSGRLRQNGRLWYPEW
jgi:acyl-CoA synthetase (AMP-forming)/AMP-acid ligase II